MMNCKILMLIPVWGRPDILKMFVDNLRNTQPEYCELIPFFILSNEDPHFARNESTVSGFMFSLAQNQPLGEKKNIGLWDAMQYKWDYLMDMGSDDLFTHYLWDVLEDYIMTREPYFGINNLYFYNLETHKARFVDDYHLNRKDEVAPVGPGRCIRRDIVDELAPLWPAIHSGMDGHSDLKIQNAGHKPLIIDTADCPVVCDVKTDTHLTPWEYLDDMGEDVDAAMVRDAFGIPAVKIPIDTFHTIVLKQSTDCTRREAFDRMNEEHREICGRVRFADYDSYRVQITKLYKRKNNGY